MQSGGRVRVIAAIVAAFLCGGVVAAVGRRAGGRIARAVLVAVGLREPTVPRQSYDRDLRLREVAPWEGAPATNLPNWKVRPGFDLIEVAGGFTFPVNIAFVERPGPGPDAPLFYVNELHGVVKLVTRSGRVEVFAEGLINFRPDLTKGYSDETGLNGLATIPGSEDLLLTAALRDEESGLLRNHVLRLVSAPGGRRCARVETLFAPDEPASAAHQVQAARVGPDGKLWVSIGDAMNYALPRDPERFAGKILRMELDGSACVDNPFYDPARPRAARSYVWALGLRNVFDITFHPDTREPFGADNGERIDRLVHLRRGVDYCWDGTDDSTRVNALYTWGPELNVSPCGTTFLRTDVLGPGTRGRLVIGAFGQAIPAGRHKPKMLLEATIDPATSLLAALPTPLLQYTGQTKATVLGVAEGPDGVYFTDFFGETNAAFQRGAGRVFKLVPSTAPPRRSAAEPVAELPPAARGAAHFVHHCAPCHALRGEGGTAGPPLDGLPGRLAARLSSPSYEAHLTALLASEASFYMSQRPRLATVLATRGQGRLRAWLHNHIREPRFDTPDSRMPGFPHLPATTVDDLVEFLLAQDR